MGYENDFVSKELVEVDVDGRKFKIKDLNGPEMDALTEKFLQIDLETKVVSMDLAIKNNELLKCVMDAPYEKDGKKFAELSEEDRLGLLNSLRNSVRSKLLKAINERLNLSDELKKK